MSSLALATSARGDASPVVTLRLAAIAPDGTAWARELREASRGAEAASRGRVRLKWYFGGIAGQEYDAAQRIDRGQLDGMASGGPVCQRVSPTLLVFNVP